MVAPIQTIHMQVVNRHTPSPLSHLSLYEFERMRPTVHPTSLVDTVNDTVNP